MTFRHLLSRFANFRACTFGTLLIALGCMLTSMSCYHGTEPQLTPDEVVRLKYPTWFAGGGWRDQGRHARDERFGCKQVQSLIRQGWPQDVAAQKFFSLFVGVGFSEAFTQDCVHFIIAGSGGEGDNAALFQVVQNTLTRSLNDEVDIGLGRFGRGLEDGRGHCGIRCLGLLRR